jgi:hypothetical protein
VVTEVNWDAYGTGKENKAIKVDCMQKVKSQNVPMALAEQLKSGSTGLQHLWKYPSDLINQKKFVI